MKKGRLLSLAVINLVGFLSVVVVNTLASTLPINNMDTGQLSDLYPNLFVPAGLTFAIWGVIYILLAIFVIYGFREALRGGNEDGSFLETIGIWFIISCLANIGWIFTWHYLLVPVSLVLMVVLLLSLIMIYLRLNVGRTQVSTAVRYMVHLPFSVYFGWITIATIANVVVLLVNIGWDAFGVAPEIWTMLLIAVAIIITLVMLWRHGDVFYALVVDWAALGILIKRMAGTTGADRAVMVAAAVAMGIITIAVIIQAFQQRRRA